MEKLIELLNEYENYLDTTNRDDIQVHFRHINWADVKCFHNYSLIISKRYLFIKWLVDNDKIDRVEVWSTGMTKPTYGYTTEPYTTCKSIKLENTILMVLSIQENAIEFLINILK